MKDTMIGVDLAKSVFQIDSRPSPSYKILEMTIETFQGLGKNMILPFHLRVKSWFTDISLGFVQL